MRWVSDPYSKNPSGNDPYGPPPPGGQGQPGQPAQNPYSPPAQPGYGGGGGGGYGGGGYGGGGYPGGPDPMSPKTDGVSIAALVVSFLCCLAPVGVILGFVGLGRTKGGQRKGRGLAIAGIVIGILMSLVTGGLIATIVFFANKVVTPDNAEVGQCVSVEEEDNSVFLYEQDCDSDHDAEIVGTARVNGSNIDAIRDGMVGYCLEAIDAGDLAKLTDYVDDIKAVIEDPDDVETGDTLVCYVEPSEDLTAPLL